MSEQIISTEQQLLSRLRQVYGDKKWIIAGGIAQGIDGGVRTVRKLGAADAIALACRIGVGELSDDVRFIITDDAHVDDDASMVEQMHDNYRELHDLPAWATAEIDEWDPEQEARVVVNFTFDGAPIAGRETFGARRPEWAALEDKITIREIWKAAGITTAPDRVVDVSDTDALLAAHRQLATRWGSVWAVDNDQGWHGGGVGTHWVTTEQRAGELAAELAGSHSRVRIQPFLEGVPCSVHGMVLADATIAFRPCEMLVLLDEERHEFEYCRTATFWDPAAEAREEMRTVAKAIGEVLRDRVDFRGIFTLDGVLTVDGFRPTEVNPRFGAALPPRLPTSDGGGELPLFFTNLIGVEGHLDDIDPAAIEELIVTRLDEHRSGGCIIFTETAPPGNDPSEQPSVAIGATWTGSEFIDLHAIADDDEDTKPIATASWGKNPGGGLVFTNFTDQLPIGPPVAATVVTIRAFLSDRWNLGLRPLRPAFDS